MKVLSKFKALRFDAGGLNEDLVYNVYFKSDNPKYKNMDGFGNNPPAVFHCTNVFSLLERLEDEIEDDVAITAVEESEPMEVNAFNDGGEIGGGNMEMVVSDVKAIKHHADELSNIVNKNTPIEAWVVSKISRAETDLSDVTHYLDGLKMEKGGLTGDLHSLTDKLLSEKIIMFIEKVKPIKYYYINELTNSLIIGLDPNYMQGAKDKLSKAAKSSLDFFDLSSLKLHNNSDKNETEYSIKLKKVAKFNTGGYMAKGGRVQFTIDDEKVDSLLVNSGIDYDFMDDDGYALSSKDFAKFQVMVSDKGYNTDKIIVHDYNYGMGGETAEGVDLFEDYDNIPKNVQKVLDKFEHDFIEGNYSGLDKALKAVQKLGYTFEYYLDGQAYDLRPIGKKGKSESDGGGYFARGGGVDEGKGLYVTGRTREDNTKIGDLIDEKEYHAEWNAREGYWLFPEEEDLYDSLEKQLEEDFANYGINARFEGIFKDGGYMEKGGKLLFSQLKKGDLLIGKFPPFKEIEILDVNSKSAKVKTLKLKNVFDIFSLNNYKLKGFSDGGYMAKGGMVVTSIKDIPNFKQRLDEGKITYRGLGLGKLWDDFNKLTGTTGTRIKVDGKEYFITDEEFKTFSRDASGKLRIRFAAPFKKSYEDGGMMADGGEVDAEVEKKIKYWVKSGKEYKYLAHGAFSNDRMSEGLRYEDKSESAFKEAQRYLDEYNKRNEANYELSYFDVPNDVPNEKFVINGFINIENNRPDEQFFYSDEKKAIINIFKIFDTNKFKKISLGKLITLNGESINDIFLKIINENEKNKLYCKDEKRKLIFDLMPSKYREIKMADGGYMAEGGKVDMAMLEMELKQIKKKYPNAKVGYTFAKDSNGKGYVITAKEDGKIVYSSYKMAKGGENKNWIQDAINPDKKGALRKTAAKQGLIKGDEKLSMTDIKKLEKQGGKTAKRANLAETLKKLKTKLNASKI